MREIGAQYSKDDRTDPSGFLRRARLHQSVFRAMYLIAIRYLWKLPNKGRC